VDVGVLDESFAAEIFRLLITIKCHFLLVVVIFRISEDCLF